MTQAGDSSKRTAKRHAVDIPGRIESAAPDEAGRIRVEAVRIEDISAGGVAFSLAGIVSAGSTWMLRLDPTVGSAYCETIVIRWVAPGEEGRHRCGAQIVSGSELFLKAGLSLADIVGDLPQSRTAGVATRGMLILDQPVALAALSNVVCRARAALHVAGDLLGCELDAARELVVGGALAGGQTCSGAAVAVGELCHKDGRETRLILGAIPEAQLLLQRVPEQLAEYDRTLTEMRSKIDQLEALGDDANHEQREQLTELMFEAPEIETKRQRLEEKVEQLQEIARAKRQVSLKVEHRIHPGVTLHLDNQTYIIEQTITGPATIQLDGDEQLIVETEKTAIPLEPAAD